MGDKAENEKLWRRLRAAVRKYGLSTSCACSGYRSQSYGLWQINRLPPAESWHAAWNAYAGGMVLRPASYQRACRRTLTLPGVARVTLEAPQWT